MELELLFVSDSTGETLITVARAAAAQYANAKTLGLDVPPALLARADEVIE